MEKQKRKKGGTDHMSTKNVKKRKLDSDQTKKPAAISKTNTNEEGTTPKAAVKKKVELPTGNSNWKALQQTLPPPKRPRKPVDKDKHSADSDSEIPKKKTKMHRVACPPAWGENKEKTKILALDCEMVGAGIGGARSMLAEIVIVNSFGNVIYHKKVAPTERVTDYRTKYSGIEPHHLVGAEKFEIVQKEVAEILDGSIIVGHGLQNDFKVLLLSHPFNLLRDTARYFPLQRKKGKPHSLRYLVAHHLNISIQKGSHDPTEDARAALLLYNKFKQEWDKKVKTKIKMKQKKSRYVQKQIKLKKRIRNKAANEEVSEEERSDQQESHDEYSSSENE